MEQIYRAVLAAQQAAIAALVPGALLSAAHAAASASLSSAGFGDLLPKLPKSVGFAMGLELREGKLQLTASNDTKVAPKMVFNVSVGLADIDNAEGDGAKDKVYSVQVADTIVVVEQGANEVVTRWSNAGWDAVSYVIKDEEDEAEEHGSLDELDESPRRCVQLFSFRRFWVP
jgi:Xaa-Pro aminopeptidase